MNKENIKLQSLIQSNIINMYKLLDNNKFTPNKELLEKLNSFKTQIQKHVNEKKQHRSNIDIDNYKLVKQNYPNELRWDIPSSKSSLLPIPREQIEINEYLEYFSKLIKEFTAESDKKQKELTNNNMIDTLDLYSKKNDKSIINDKMKILEEAIETVLTKNNVFEELLKFEVIEIPSKLFIDPECVVIDLIQLINTYDIIDKDKTNTNTNINKNNFLTELNKISEPSLEEIIGLNLYELLINPNLEYLLSPLNLSILPTSKNNNTVFPLFKKSVKELITNINNTKNYYDEILKEVQDNEEIYITTLLKDQIESLNNNKQILLKKIENAINNNKDKKEFIDIIIKTKNKHYNEIFNNFIKDNNNIFNEYDIFKKELNNFTTTIRTLKTDNETYINILNEYLKIEKLTENYQKIYNSFLDTFKVNKNYDKLIMLESFRNININEEINTIDCINKYNENTIGIGIVIISILLHLSLLFVLIHFKKYGKINIISILLLVLANITILFLPYWPYSMKRETLCILYNFIYLFLYIVYRFSNTIQYVIRK